MTLDLKTQDRKMEEQLAGHENAEPENAGPCYSNS